MNKDFDFDFGFLKEPVLELAKKIKPTNHEAMAIVLLSLTDLGKRFQQKSLEDISIFNSLSLRNLRLIKNFINSIPSEKVAGACVFNSYWELVEMYPDLKLTKEQVDELTSEAEKVFPLDKEKSKLVTKSIFNYYSNIQKINKKNEERYFIISRILNNKFGVLPDDIATQLKLLDNAQLLILLDQILLIKTIEDLKEALNEIQQDRITA